MVTFIGIVIYSHILQCPLLGTVTADNYQYQAHNSSLSTPSVQPTELPNYSTSHQPASTGVNLLSA